MRVFVAKHQAMQYGLEGDYYKYLLKSAVLHHCRLLNTKLKLLISIKQSIMPNAVVAIRKNK
jgi:hypothetical protein